MTPTDTNHLLNGMQSLGNTLGQPLVSITKVANDVVGSNAVDVFMDSAKGIGHRIVHGHSLDNLPLIYKKFGASGVLDYSSHGLRDAMSPHGMPIPFASEIATELGLRPLTAVHWLCFNVGDVLAGGLSVVHSIHNIGLMNEAVASGFLSPQLAISTALGSTIKIGFALGTTNPVSLAAGVIDLGVLVWALAPTLSLGQDYFVGPTGVSGSTIFLGAVSGAASAAAIGGALHATTEPSKSSWLERMKRITFSGAIGGALGAGISTLSANPIVISSAAVGGYVAGEWIYEQTKVLKSPIADKENDFLPDFLVEAFC